MFSFLFVIYFEYLLLFINCTMLNCKKRKEEIYVYIIITDKYWEQMSIVEIVQWHTLSIMFVMSSILQNTIWCTKPWIFCYFQPIIQSFFKFNEYTLKVKHIYEFIISIIENFVTNLITMLHYLCRRF